MANKDLYGVLGVPRTANGDDIKKAYRKLAKQYHPDHNSGDKGAEERFKEISAAFTVLSDPSRRRRYDEFGIDGLREGFDSSGARHYRQWANQNAPGGGPGFTFDGSFADLFGGGGGGRGGRGGGAQFGGFGDLEDILGGLFGGTRQAPPKRGRNVERTVTISARNALEGCEVRVPGVDKRVRVPPGVGAGQRIRVPNTGQPGATGAGHLLLVVEIATPPGFTQNGNDLEIDVPLTIKQAMMGDAVEVPTPEGRTVQLKIPPGSQSGQRMRLRGKGMPAKGGQRGDLFVRLLVRIPTTDDPRALDLAEKLDEFY